MIAIIQIIILIIIVVLVLNRNNNNNNDTCISKKKTERVELLTIYFIGMSLPGVVVVCHSGMGHRGVSIKWGIRDIDSGGTEFVPADRSRCPPGRTGMPLGARPSRIP